MTAAGNGNGSMPRHGPLVVVGDVLLDIDIEGRADRCSPDAAVPVVDVAAKTYRPGGAGLAGLLAAQDGDTVLIGGFADDDAGVLLRRLLDERVHTLALPVTGSTVCKERVRAHGPWAGPAAADAPAPITRLDFGDGRLRPDLLPETVRAALSGARAILVADYGRGVADHPQLRAILAALGGQIPVVWDPHPRGPTPVPGATLATPNRSEAEQLAPDGGRGHDLGDRARDLARRWSARAIAITLGAEGAVVYQQSSPDPRQVPIPTELRAARITDTCGAGDRFATAATAALAAGAAIEAAVEHAVAAAAEFVSSGAAAALAVPDPSNTQPGPGISATIVTPIGRSPRTRSEATETQCARHETHNPTPARTRPASLPAAPEQHSAAPPTHTPHLPCADHADGGDAEPEHR
ncbi:PfkB family carbohydrate kinase [Nocardia donostiensis]|uniref:PfkB family carbohydrate kinase n=1 Tax=Nocardia donostiensis TaxID=1538463 RepID=UPI0009DA34EB|nr:PfkB family carbohydrate kinase [Nocardia donostiensis]